MGSIIMLDKEMKEIKHFLMLPNTTTATCIHQSNDGTVYVGCESGELFRLSEDQSFIQLWKGIYKEKITKLYFYQSLIIVQQLTSVTILDQANQQNLYSLCIPSQIGSIAQITFINNLQILLIQTSQQQPLVYDIQSQVLKSISGLTQAGLNTWAGCCFNFPHQKYVFTQTSSQLAHVDTQSNSLDFATNYKNKKKEFQFGNLFTLTGKRESYAEDILLSVNLDDGSIVTIDLKNNKLLSFEKLQFDSHFYSYDKETRTLTFIYGGTQLQIAQYKIATLLETYQIYQGNLKKLKAVIKLILKYKDLQQLDLLEPFLVKIVRKEHNQELKESKEFQSFIDLIKFLEQKKKESEVQMFNNMSSQNDDDGFETLDDFSTENYQQPLVATSSNPPTSVSESILRERIQSIEKQKQKEQERLAKKLYREGKRINRQLRIDQFQSWLKQVFLGNLLRLTFWTNKPVLMQWLQQLQSTQKYDREGLLILVKVILLNNTFESLVEAMIKRSYTDYSFARKMIHLKFYMSRDQHDLYIFSNAKINQRYFLVTSYLPMIKRAIVISRVHLKVKCGIELTDQELRILSLYNQCIKYLTN